MHELTEEYLAYSRYRYEKASGDLKAAKVMLDIGEYASANNRAKL